MSGAWVVGLAIVALAVMIGLWGIFDRLMEHREHRLGHDVKLEEARKIELLANENAELIGKIDRLQERLAVLERIATDPAKRTADEIEKLRD